MTFVKKQVIAPMNYRNLMMIWSLSKLSRFLIRNNGNSYRVRIDTLGPMACKDLTKIITGS